MARVNAVETRFPTSALNAAVQAGQIERLPLDFYATAEPDGEAVPDSGV